MRQKKLKNLILSFSCALLICLNHGLYAEEGKTASTELLEKAWAAHGKRDIEATAKFTQQLIDLYKDEADK